MEPGGRARTTCFSSKSLVRGVLAEDNNIKKNLMHNGTLGGGTEQHLFPFPAMTMIEDLKSSV